MSGDALSGVFVDLKHAIAKDAGLTVQYQVMTFADLSMVSMIGHHPNNACVGVAMNTVVDVGNSIAAVARTGFHAGREGIKAYARAQEPADQRDFA
jgi:hypothetical protein